MPPATHPVVSPMEQTLLLSRQRLQLERDRKLALPRLSDSRRARPAGCRSPGCQWPSGPWIDREKLEVEQLNVDVSKTFLADHVAGHGHSPSAGVAPLLEYLRGEDAVLHDPARRLAPLDRLLGD